MRPHLSGIAVAVLALTIPALALGQASKPEQQIPEQRNTINQPTALAANSGPSSAAETTVNRSSFEMSEATPTPKHQKTQNDEVNPGSGWCWGGGQTYPWRFQAEATTMPKHQKSHANGLMNPDKFEMTLLPRHQKRQANEDTNPDKVEATAMPKHQKSQNDDVNPGSGWCWGGGQTYPWRCQK